MACTPKPVRLQRKRDRNRARKSCGFCGCCPCAQVGCDWCPAGGRRRGESVRMYIRRRTGELHAYGWEPSPFKRRKPKQEKK